MKELKTRQAFREWQREQEKAERDAAPHNPRGGEEEENEPFDAESWIDDTVENVKGQLSDLNDDELTAVEEAEKAAKNRAGVLDAISTEKNKRTQAATSWKAQN